jgi:hypothetical protein
VEPGAVPVRSGTPRRLAELAAPVAILLGCASRSPREPVEPVIETPQPAADGREDLIATLGRATDPRVTEMSVTGEVLHFRSLVPMYGVPGIPLGDIPRETRIQFDAIREVEAHEDRNVTIELIGGRVERIRFATQEDARRFARLLLGMRASAGEVP